MAKVENMAGSPPHLTQNPFGFRGYDFRTRAQKKWVKITLHTYRAREPRRHIGKLTLDITLPAALDEKARTILERTAHTCPVQASMGELTEIALTFHYV